MDSGDYRGSHRGGRCTGDRADRTFKLTEQADSLHRALCPGGTTDILARTVGERLGAALGQPIFVENRPAPGGSIGAAELARAAPDGYTTGGGPINSHAINATLYDRLSYDPVTRALRRSRCTQRSRTYCCCERHRQIAAQQLGHHLFQCRDTEPIQGDGRRAKCSIVKETGARAD